MNYRPPILFAPSKSWSGSKGWFGMCLPTILALATFSCSLSESASTGPDFRPGTKPTPGTKPMGSIPLEENLPVKISPVKISQTKAPPKSAADSASATLASTGSQNILDPVRTSTSVSTTSVSTGEPSFSYKSKTGTQKEVSAIDGITSSTSCGEDATNVPESPTFLTVSPAGDRRAPPQAPGLTVGRGQNPLIQYLRHETAGGWIGLGQAGTLLRSGPKGWAVTGTLPATGGAASGITAGSFNSRFTAVAAASGPIVRVFGAGGKDLAVLDTLTTRSVALSFHPCEPVLYIGGVDGVIYRWRYEGPWSESLGSDRRRLERYLGHGVTVSALWVHPEGRVFFSGDWRGKVFAWRNFDADAFGGKYDRSRLAGRGFSDLADVQPLPRNADGMAIDFLRGDRAGERLFLATAAGELEVWQVRGLHKVASIAAHRGALKDLFISADGRSIASVGRDGMVRRWSVVQTAARSATHRGTEQISLMFEVERRDIKAVAISNEGDLIGVTEQGVVVGVQDR